MHGYIYFLTNPSMPNMVKVGHTTLDINVRMKQLHSTGTPTPFTLAACFYVTNANETEKRLHKILSQYRVSNNREFFTASISDILTTSMPLILSNVESNVFSSSSALKVQNSFELEKETIDLLCHLAGDYRNHGYNIYSVLDCFTKEPKLKTKARLAELKELKLATEKHSRKDGYIDTIWRITSKGIKYLFDNNYITNEMLHEPFYLHANILKPNFE